MLQLRDEFRNDLRNHKYEIDDSNRILLARHKVWVGGIMGSAVRRAGEIIMPWEFEHNVLTDEGINHLINVNWHDTAKTAIWYVAIHTAGSPATGTTAATYHSTHTETTAYDESTRVEYNNAASSSKSTTNSANKATFTMNASVTVTGGGLLSVSAKRSTSGVLSAVANFASSRPLLDDDQLLVSYTISAADDGV